MTARHLSLITDVLLLAAIEAFMMVFLDVRVLFYDTIVTGGDTASWHGIADHLLKVLLPSGRLTGWDMGNFCGYPNFTFYFIPPFLLAALPSYLFGLPLTITLKLSMASGIFLLPIMTYLGLRAMRYRFPIPVIGASSTLLFLFNESYTMFGGNVLSTNTGEFCYMFAFALFAYFIGSLQRGVETEESPLKNGILLGIIGLSHLFVFIPAVCLLVYWFLARGKVRYLMKVSVVAFGLMAFWILPLIAYRHPYTTPVYMIWQQFVSWRYTFLGIGIMLIFLGPRLALAALTNAGPVAATKSECRNPKFETNSKRKCSNVQNGNPSPQGFGHLNLVHWILFRISCFGFRIFNFFANEREVAVKDSNPPLAKGWGLGVLAFAGLGAFTFFYLGATYLVLGQGLFDTGLEISPLSASPLGAERARLLRPWVAPVSLLVSMIVLATGIRARKHHNRFEKFSLSTGAVTFLIGIVSASIAIHVFVCTSITDVGMRTFFLKPWTMVVIHGLITAAAGWLLFFHRSFAAFTLRVASQADSGRFGMFLGLAFGCVSMYFAAHFLAVPDIRFLPPLLFVLILIFFADTLDPFLSASAWSTKLASALMICYGCALVVIFGTSKSDFWLEYNSKGYESRPGYPEFRKANLYLKTVYQDSYPDPLNAPRVGYEKCNLYGPYGGDRVFESLPLFAGRQTMEGIHYASSIASTFMAFLQTAYSRDIKTPRSYVLSRLNPKVLPAYLDLYNMSQLILMTDKAREAIATSPLFEKEAAFGDISIYRYKGCDGRYVDVPECWPVLYTGSDWVEDFFRWYKAGDHLDLLLVPKRYVRDKQDRDLFPNETDRVERLGPLPREALDRRDLKIVCHLDHRSIRFTTNKVGLPHLIKVSYYPNWKVEGARGVYPVSPHLMMVIPREGKVVLTYEKTFWDWLGTGITGLTLLIMVVWASANALGRMAPGPAHAKPSGASRSPYIPVSGSGKTSSPLWQILLPAGLIRLVEGLRPYSLTFVLLMAVSLIAGGAIYRNKPVRAYVSGYEAFKMGMDFIQEKKPEMARPCFDKAIQIMAPIIEERRRHDHQDVILCMLFTAASHENLGRWAKAEGLYSKILEEYPYSRFVGEAYVKIGRLKRQGRNSLLDEGLTKFKAGDDSGLSLVQKALQQTHEVLRYFETAIKEDSYSVWAEYALSEIKQEKDYLRAKQPLIETIADKEEVRQTLATILRERAQDKGP